MVFEPSEIIIQLFCRHHYHSECINDYALSESQPVCPVCVGPCSITDRFRCGMAEPAPRREDFFGSASSSFMAPWYPAPNTPQPQGYFYAKTGLPDGRPAALIDPGAWTSANGRALAVAAYKNGYKSSQKKMETPLKLAGVRAGVQQ